VAAATRVAVAVWEDRHADAAVRVFSDPAEAVKWAEKVCRREGRKRRPPHYDRKELTPGMERDGWLFWAEYSCENDCVRVVMAPLDDKRTKP
jgi:hypothetical protein